MATLEELQKQLVDTTEKLKVTEGERDNYKAKLEETKTALDGARALNQSLSTKLLDRLNNPVATPVSGENKAPSLSESALSWYTKKE